MKIYSKLGAFAFIMHTVVAVVMAFGIGLFSMKGAYSGEAGWYALLMIFDLPIVMPVMMFKIPQLERLLSNPIGMFVYYIVAGGLFWYLIGWGVARLIDRYSTIKD